MLYELVHIFIHANFWVFSKTCLDFYKWGSHTRAVYCKCGCTKEEKSFCICIINLYSTASTIVQWFSWFCDWCFQVVVLMTYQMIWGVQYIKMCMFLQLQGQLIIVFSRYLNIAHHHFLVLYLGCTVVYISCLFVVCASFVFLESTSPHVDI